MKNKTIFIIGTTSSNLYLFRKDFLISCIDKGYKVYALISDSNKFWDDKIRDTGSQLILYNIKRAGLNPLSDIRSMFEIKSYIDSYKPLIVFSFFTKPVIYGSLAAKLAKTPRIVGMIEGLGSPFTVHPSGQSFKMKVVRFFQISLYRIVFPFLDKIIFLNKDDPIDLIKKNKIYHKQNVVEVLGPIGLCLEDYPYKPWDEDREISFIFIARLLAEKGVFEYLEAAKIVKEKYPSVVFKIIGGLDTENPNGLSKKELDEIIESGLVQYPGFVTDVAKRIQDSAVFVLPSYYREGVPRSTQEAMAVGRPVITTDVPGCRETVVDGVNGFLVPKWDSKALAAKMCYFVENPKQINVMGVESFHIAQEKFDADKINLKLLEIMGLTSKK